MDLSTKTTEVNLALQVALQTMKERCVTLQKRLTSVEEENQELRERIEDKRSNGTTFSPPTNGAAELFQLRLQLSDMQRQKTHMTEHLNMVSEENRKLWSRLSQIAKEHEHILGLVKDHNDILISDSFSVGATQINDELIKSRGAAARAALAQQNLIRSKTFTQHSPNPNLRHKLLTDENASALSNELEELTYENDELENEDENDNFDMEVQKCQEVMLELHREARSQHVQLKSAFEMLESKLASMPCPECMQRSKKPEMADKSLETDDSLSELQIYNNNNNNSNNNTKHDSHNNNVSSDMNQTLPQTRLNIIQEKVAADAMDKTCPMCARTYNSNVSFEAFRNHVEQHFIDDTYDVENSLEHNFEFVSRAVGDF